MVNISTTYLPKQARTRNYGRQRRCRRTRAIRAIRAEWTISSAIFTPFGNGNGMPEMQRKGQALGSGVVVDRAGYI